MRTAVFVALLAASSAKVLEEQPVNLNSWWPFAPLVPKQQPSSAPTIPELTPTEGPPESESSLLKALPEALKQQLRAPSKQVQQGLAAVAGVLGLVCMANGEVMLFQIIVFGTFVVSALLMHNEAAAMWGAGSASDSALSMVTALEAGLASTVIVFYAYDGVLLVIGALVGCFIAHVSEKFVVSTLGVDAATFDEHVVFVWYSIFTLGCWGLVARKMHGKYLGVVTSFFGGGLVASSVLFVMQAHQMWVDCLGELLGGADVTPGYVPVVTNTTAQVTAWGEADAVRGFSNFHLVGYAIWAVCFLAGAKFQFSSKAAAKAKEAGSYNNFVTIDP